MTSLKDSAFMMTLCHWHQKTIFRPDFNHISVLMANFRDTKTKFHENQSSGNQAVHVDKKIVDSFILW